MTQHGKIDESQEIRVARKPGMEVSPLTSVDAPSAAFGWHANFNSNVKQVVGWLIVLSLLLLNIGNQQGHIENLYLVGFAVTIAIFLLRELYLRRKSNIPLI